MNELSKIERRGERGGEEKDIGTNNITRSKQVLSKHIDFSTDKQFNKNYYAICIRCVNVYI